LNWLKDVLHSDSKEATNIIVFFHQLLWSEKDGVFKNYQLNSYSGRGEEVNFQTEIKPLFEKTNKST
jgi:hypothetical protein